MLGIKQVYLSMNILNHAEENKILSCSQSCFKFWYKTVFSTSKLWNWEYYNVCCEKDTYYVFGMGCHKLPNFSKNRGPRDLVTVVCPYRQWEASCLTSGNMTKCLPAVKTTLKVAFLPFSRVHGATEHPVTVADFTLLRLSVKLKHHLDCKNCAL